MVIKTYCFAMVFEGVGGSAGGRGGGGAESLNGLASTFSLSSGCFSESHFHFAGMLVGSEAINTKIVQIVRMCENTLPNKQQQSLSLTYAFHSSQIPFSVQTI